MNENEKNDDIEFLRGVICALAVVVEHDNGVLYSEIVSTVNRKELYATAQRDGALRWIKWSKYMKEEPR